MILSFIFFVFYLVFLFFFRERAYYYIYNLFTLLFGVFLCAKLDPSSNALIYHIFAVGMFLPIIPYLRKYLRFILVFFAILTTYIIFKFVGWQIDVIRMFMDLRISIFAACLCLAMFEDFNHGRLSIRLLVRGIYILVLIQILLAIFQYLVPAANNFLYIESPDANLDADDRAMKLDMNLLTGTLMTPSALAGFLVVSVLVLFVYELEKNNMKIPQIFFTFVSIGVAFLCGIRTPFFFFVLFAVIYLFSYQRKLFLSLLPAFIVALFLIVAAATVSHEGAVGRMLEGFSQAASGYEGLQETTLAYSFLMVPYFVLNPLFGVSLGPDRYLMFGVYSLSDMSVTDVYLMFILCEYGLIGLLLFLYPFFQIKKLFNASQRTSIVSIKQSSVLLFVAYGVCLAIVDKGIFHYLELVLLMTGIVLFSCGKTACKKISF